METQLKAKVPVNQTGVSLLNNDLEKVTVQSTAELIEKIRSLEQQVELMKQEKQEKQLNPEPTKIFERAQTAHHITRGGIF